MDFDIRRNVRQVERGLSDFAQTQLPFALSLMLNWTAEDIRKNSEKGLSRKLDRPTPFTQRAFAILRSTKRRLTASVFAKDRQAEYLKYAEEGGARSPKGKAVVIPVGQRTNKYGNMPKGAIKRQLAKPNVFSGKPKGDRPGGIYKRTKRGLRLLVDYASRAIYSPRLGFKSGARRTAEQRAPVHFETAMRRAIKTARR